jgi:hypothetical protein
MSKEELATTLRVFYARTKRRISLGESEFVLEDIFGVENISSWVAEQFEDVYKDFFVDQKIDTKKRIIFSYDDIYDFLNTILGIDMNDFIIFFTHDEMLEYTMSLLHVLNRAFNNWVQNRKSGFRKGTRLFLELDREGIHLCLKPEIKA